MMMAAVITMMRNPFQQMEGVKCKHICLANSFIISFR